MVQWVDLRENLQETIDFLMKLGFSSNFSLKPINCMVENPGHKGDFGLEDGGNLGQFWNLNGISVSLIREKLRFYAGCIWENI